jgi:hypothetical protein
MYICFTIITNKLHKFQFVGSKTYLYNYCKNIQNAQTKL